MLKLNLLTMIIVTRSIVGLKKEESEALLNFLYLHIAKGIDFQARVRWAPGTVVVWDVSLSTTLDKKLTDSKNRIGSLCTRQPWIGSREREGIWLGSHLKLRLLSRLRMSSQSRKYRWGSTLWPSWKPSVWTASSVLIFFPFFNLFVCRSF